ncbi:hypothetical protein HMPREF9374_0935, partial [Desmospora sp. 8437]
MPTETRGDPVGSFLFGHMDFYGIKGIIFGCRGSLTVVVMHMRKGWQRRKSLKKQQLLEERSREKLNQKLDEAPVFLEVKKNADFIKNILGDSTDLIMRWFTIQYTPDR